MCGTEGERGLEERLAGSCRRWSGRSGSRPDAHSCESMWCCGGVSIGRRWGEGGIGDAQALMGWRGGNGVMRHHEWGGENACNGE